ncbi:MAG: VWA domain-containing protein [Chromatiales bacterium]|nr:VWA domain-containing protein [Chromatiales bacterium]
MNTQSCRKITTGQRLLSALFGAALAIPVCSMADDVSDPQAFNPEADVVGNMPVPFNPEADEVPVDAEPVEPAAPQEAVNADDVPTVTGDGLVDDAGGEGDTQARTQAAIPLQRKLTMKREISLRVSCEGEGVCREAETAQPLRVLPKSFSHVYKGKDATADNIAIENVPAYKVLYVFARDDLDLSDPAEPKGWYQVAQGVRGPATGWMRAQDVLEWKQALVVAYRHRGLGDMRREPLLMFRDLEALQEVVESPVREGMATLLYEKIRKGDIPESVASREPERYIDIDQKFYLLPILDFEVTDLDGDEARYLQIAAAVPRKRGADVLEDETYREQAEEKPALTTEQAKAMKMDVVFVMDMSRSMQPYIDSTRDAIRELVQGLSSDPTLKDDVRFGLVGYRDDMRKIPALEFTSKNLTPALVGADELIEILDKQAKATLVGSMDYPEEVYAGVDTALGSSWTEGAVRFLVLVGDASAHEEDHPQSTTGKNAEVLNLAARQTGIRILAMHLLDPRMTSDHAIAKRQYGSLSRIEGSDDSALLEFSTEDREAFAAAVKDSTSLIYKTLEKARKGGLVADEEPGAPNEADQPEETPSEASKTMEKLMESALIEYLGKEAEPPKDIVVWVLDRDIGNPILNALDVRVLLTKDQLSDLIKSIDQVTKALARAEYSNQQFFEALQSVAGQTLKQPEAIEKAQMLANTGLLPSFVHSLPYKSEVLSLSNDMYASMTAEQRSALESNLRAKLRQYQDINEQVDGWISLNEADPDASKVYPLFLDYLP